MTAKPSLSRTLVPWRHWADPKPNQYATWNFELKTACQNLGSILKTTVMKQDLDNIFKLVDFSSNIQIACKYKININWDKTFIWKISQLKLAIFRHRKSFKVDQKKYGLNKCLDYFWLNLSAFWLFSTSWDSVWFFSVCCFWLI